MEGRRILVVASDASVREAIALAMADVGAEVSLAADGADALALLRSGPCPSVILIDHRLPGLGGDDLLREMRADPRFEHVPVITMTGGTAVSEDGALVARLQKPLDLADLREIVLSLFDIAA